LQQTDRLLPVGIVQTAFFRIDAKNYESEKMLFDIASALCQKSLPLCAKRVATMCDHRLLSGVCHLALPPTIRLSGHPSFLLI
jgi:hypothetical protein